MSGLGGNDLLSGDGGSDDLRGGLGADSLFGRDGNDWLYGDAENDSLYGDAGDDWLFGGDGNDTLNGGLGSDTTDGGVGNDNHEIKGAEGATDRFADSSGTADRITNIDATTPVVFKSFDGPSSGIENFYANNADVIGTNDSNVIDFRTSKTTYMTIFNIAAIRGLGGNDTIFGGRANNVIYGGDGDDTIYGGDLNDSLYGDAGNDILFGLAGTDTIVGGFGSDTASGGTGIDYFRFDRSADNSADNDVITDWSADYIMLYGYQTADFSTEFVAGALSINPTGKKITLTGVTTRPSATYIKSFA